MTLRAEYALGHSEFNDFLFAFVGAEKNGVELTVLSALTRLGLDPWGEAARLSDMPKDSAVRVLGVTIAYLPAGDWKVSDSRMIAARLVERLPRHGAPARRPRREQATARPKAKPWGVKWLFVVGLVAGALFLALHHDDGQPSGPVPAGMSSNLH